jgi:hypothetical protein
MITLPPVAVLEPCAAVAPLSVLAAFACCLAASFSKRLACAAFCLS